MWAVFANTGQDCCARSRIFVERPAYEAFIEALGREDRHAARGASRSREETDLGPLVSAGQRQTALDYLEIGQKEGARLVTGGDVPEVPDGANGFYLRPAILADVDNAWRVAQEEIFGPVACVIPFDTEEEAIRLANDDRVRALGFDLDPRSRPSDQGREGDPDRRVERELVAQRAHRGALRRLQAERHRPRDGDARGEPVHRGQERATSRRRSRTEGRHRVRPWRDVLGVRGALSADREGAAPTAGPPGSGTACQVGSPSATGSSPSIRRSLRPRQTRTDRLGTSTGDLAVHRLRRCQSRGRPYAPRRSRTTRTTPTASKTPASPNASRASPQSGPSHIASRIPTQTRRVSSALTSAATHPRPSAQRAANQARARRNLSRPASSEHMGR